MLIWRSQRPSETNEFVKNNEPSSLGGTPGDSWRKYLSNNGGTGQTFYDKEQGYLQSKGQSTWDKYLNSLGYLIGILRERMRSFLRSIISAPASSRYLSEADDIFQLEDGTGYYIQES